MYLQIENQGWTDYRAFTIMGVSTSRNYSNQSIIGTFGTGLKQSLACLLRNKIRPIIYIDKLCMEFFEKEIHIKDNLDNTRHSDQVLVKLSGKLPDGSQVNRTEETGFTTELGIHDWTDINMALREFVSNAIDHTTKHNSKEYDDITNVVNDNQVRAKTGATRIFIPMHDERVHQFCKTLGKRFLHFSDNNAINRKILDKNYRSLTGNNYPVFYKRGVFVRQDESSKLDSVYDYNFDSELNLDESRRVDDWHIRSAAANLLRFSEPEILAPILSSLIRGDKVWEGELDVYGYIYDDTLLEKVKDNWQKAWKIATGDAILVRYEVDFIKERITRKGYTGVSLRNDKWVRACEFYGITTDSAILGQDVVEGKEILPPTEELSNYVKHTWEVLKSIDMINGKEMPEVAMFNYIMNADKMVNGYYKFGGNTIYINQSIVGNTEQLYQVIIEELGHYISGESDMSRAFQNFAFQVASKLMFVAHPYKEPDNVS